MNSKIDIVFNDASRRDFTLRSAVFINIDDDNAVENASSKFKDVYVFTFNQFIMGQYKRMMRRCINIHPSYVIDLSKLKNVDLVVLNKTADLTLFNLNKTKYVCFISECPKSLYGFKEISENVFIKDDDIISLTSDMNDKASFVRLKSIRPIQHSYGEHKKIEKGKTDLIGRDESVLDRKYECPYSNAWIFKKASDLSCASNEIILKDDISDEDMLKIVEILSNAEHKVLVK